MPTNPYEPPKEVSDDDPDSPSNAVPIYDHVTALLIKIAAVPAGIAVFLVVTGAVAAMLARGLPPPIHGIVALGFGIVAGIMATRHLFRVANLTRPRKPRT